MRTIDEWLEENKSKLAGYNWVVCSRNGLWAVFDEKPYITERSKWCTFFYNSFFVIKEKLKRSEDWRNSLRRIENERD